MNKKVLIITVAVIAVILVGGTLIISRPPAPSKYSHLDDFAKCLTEKKVIMYGAVWCPHCQAQKKLFSDSFRYVSYVECPDNPQKCMDAKVTGYPTWIASNGQRLEGESDLTAIAKLSDCDLR